MRQLATILIYSSLIISSCSSKLQPIVLEDAFIAPTKEEITFKAFWLNLIDSLKNSNIGSLKSISLDSLWIGNDFIPSNLFFEKCYRSVFNKKRVSLLSDTTIIRYTWTEADRSSLPSDAQNKIIKLGRRYRFKNVEISKVKKDMLHISLSIMFIETNEGYKFYGVSYIKRPRCCR